MDRSEENRAIDEVVERLAQQFPELPAADIASTVAQTRPEFEEAPIRDFVPLFVERSAKNRLRDRRETASS
ncbi:three-helix bundle dimerization domain-containing protein [Kribbella amoyensis]|nr:hypothetical protein [Kribbella amoyensis]